MDQKIRRALISVSDKAGLIEFARRVSRHSVEIVSTGGTADALRKAGLTVRDVSELTGFPEILGGRVKTLHPKVHGGILAVRDDQEHARQVADNRLEYVDMVVVNLYPFVQTISRPNTSVEDAIENIDIGGPSMIRSAAKNFRYVAVVTDPADYEMVVRDMDATDGAVTLRTRLYLARRAFETTARYDQAIASYFSDSVDVNDPGSVVARQQTGLPSLFFMAGRKESDLRYGENPHQRAALYVAPQREPGVATAEKLQGKELSYNNLIDLDAAWNLVRELQDPACVIIKHTNPCGAATAGSPEEAFEKALATDPVSAFGGIIGFNRPMNGAAGRLIAKTFFEAVVAPDYEPAAMEALASKKNLRVLKMGTALPAGPGVDLRVISGGFLVQDPDRAGLDEASLRTVTVRQPGEDEMRAMRFAWIIAKHVKSNAIVYARDGQLVAVGAGQMSRVDSVKLGAAKAVLPLEGAVLASDAFFPFRDNIDEAARTGITAVIQPGGSVRDNEVIEAANEHNLAMVFTGIRHFKH